MLTTFQLFNEQTTDRYNIDHFTRSSIVVDRLKRNMPASSFSWTPLAYQDFKPGINFYLGHRLNLKLSSLARAVAIPRLESTMLAVRVPLFFSFSIAATL